MEKMAYKNSSALEFKSKGLIDPETGRLVSTEKKDAGKEYDLKEVIKTVASDGEEIVFSIKKSMVEESTNPPLSE